MHYLRRRLLPGLLTLIVLMAGGCFGALAETGNHPAAKTTLANPASVYCLEQGGRLIIQKRNDGGEYGVCAFADNRQCEEWALFRGECPAGGIRIAGCVSPAALYCATTGGQYSEIPLEAGRGERGTCSFKNGSRCDAWDYFNGRCSKHPESVIKR